MPAFADVAVAVAVALGLGDCVGLGEFVAAVGYAFGVLLGPGHAGPLAADGSACRLASASIDAVAAAASLFEGWCAPGRSHAHTPSATIPAQRIMNRRRQ